MTTHLRRSLVLATLLLTVSGAAAPIGFVTARGLARAREYSLSRMLGHYEELLFELTEVHAGSTARI